MALIKTLATGVLAAAVCVSAGAPSVATVSSIQDIVLDGHTVAAAGVTWWPVVLGDTLQSTTSDAMLAFRDGSRVTLGPQSKLRILGSQTKPRVVLVAGTLDYRLTPGSEVTLASANDPSEPPSHRLSRIPNHIPNRIMRGGGTGRHRAPTVVHSQSYYFLEGALAAGAAVGGADAVYHSVSSKNSQAPLSPGAVSH